MASTLVLVLVGCLVSVSAGADEDAGVCAQAPTRDAALQLRTIADQSMTLAAKPLDEHQTLTTWKTVPPLVRSVAVKTRCAPFSGKEATDAQAWAVRAEKWAAAYDARLAAEETARTSVIVPLCQATWQLDAANADIAREKANPSGVHDLRLLHSAGMAAQSAQDTINALKPQYVAFRKHPFNGWKTEGACVADANRP